MTQHAFAPSLGAVVLICVIAGVSLYAALRGYRQWIPGRKALACTVLLFYVGIELVLNSAHTLVESDDWVAPYRTAGWHFALVVLGMAALLAVGHESTIGLWLSQRLFSVQRCIARRIETCLDRFHEEPGPRVRTVLRAILVATVVGIIFPVIVEVGQVVWNGITEIATSMAGPVQLNSQWAFAPPSGLLIGACLALLIGICWLAVCMIVGLGQLMLRLTRGSR